MIIHILKALYFFYYRRKILNCNVACLHLVFKVKFLSSIPFIVPIVLFFLTSPFVLFKYIILVLVFSYLITDQLYITVE